MLEGMRRHANSFVMSILFAIIIIVFVFSFGPGSAQYCGTDLPIAATVNGRAISSAEFQQRYSQTFDRMQQTRPNYTIETARAENLKQTVVDQLIGRELLLQDAMSRGIAVGDEELAKAIVDSPYFQQDGRFDRELYRRYATSLNLSEAAYEEEFRRDLVAQRMQSLLLDTMPVGEGEIRSLWERRNNRVDVWFVRVDPFPFRAKIQLEDEEVKAYAKDERAKVEDYYNQHANSYNTPEKVEARHILIKAGEDATEADVTKARESIEAAQKRVAGGEDFATVAKEVSEDGSAAQGGSLGLQPRGAWVPPFEEAAFALEEGAVSDIVRTRFGFHIIKLERKVAAINKTVDEVADKIARDILTDERSKALAKTEAEAWLGKLKAAEDPLSLNPAEGEAEGDAKPDPFAPKVDSTGSFASGERFVPKIGVSAEFAQAAFALSDDKVAPDAPIEVSGRFYAIKLKQRDKPDPDAYETDKERLRSELSMRRRMRVVDDYIKRLREQATIEFNPSHVSYQAAADTAPQQ